PGRRTGLPHLACPATVFGGGAGGKYSHVRRLSSLYLFGRGVSVAQALPVAVGPHTAALEPAQARASTSNFREPGCRDCRGGPRQSRVSSIVGGLRSACRGCRTA